LDLFQVFVEPWITHSVTNVFPKCRYLPRQFFFPVFWELRGIKRQIVHPIFSALTFMVGVGLGVTATIHCEII
jgi:hypothetical protein